MSTKYGFYLRTDIVVWYLPVTGIIWFALFLNEQENVPEIL